jgi:hypothetical protein
MHHKNQKSRQPDSKMKANAGRHEKHYLEYQNHIKNNCYQSYSVKSSQNRTTSGLSQVKSRVGY